MAQDCPLRTPEDFVFPLLPSEELRDKYRRYLFRDYVEVQSAPGVVPFVFLGLLSIRCSLQLLYSLGCHYVLALEERVFSFRKLGKPLQWYGSEEQRCHTDNCVNSRSVTSLLCNL